MKATRIIAVQTAQRGFTLVEVMVVVLIIVILMGLALGVGSAVRNMGKKQLTRAALDNAVAVADDFRVRTGRNVPHFVVDEDEAQRYGVMRIDWDEERSCNAPGFEGDDGEIDDYADDIPERDGGSEPPPYTVDDNEEPADKKFIMDRSIERFIWATSQVPAIRQQLNSSLPDGLLVDEDEPEPNGFLELRDAWGTKIIYVAFVNYEDDIESDDFLPARQNAYFASAGPDGLWGDYRELRRQIDDPSLNDLEQDAVDAAADNLYSFEAVE